MQPRLALVQVLRRREPALLVAGQSVSAFGDGVALVALTLLILDTTGSVSKLAWFAAARMVPNVLFLLVGGVIVDRFSRRILLLISDAVRAVLTGVLAVVIALHALTFGELMVFGVLFGLFDAVFAPAMTAVTPEIVPEDLLPAMNAIRPLSQNLVGFMIGPAVGGLLAAWSTTWAIAIDAVTFAISAGALTLMRPTPTPVRHEETSVVAEIRQGVGLVRRTPWIWTTLAVVTFTNALVLNPIFVLVPFFLRHTLHSSKELVGLALAASGAAGAAGALIAAHLKVPRRRIRTMWTYWNVSALSVLIIGVATQFWEVLVVLFIVPPLALMGNVIWESMLQSEVPRHMLGRVSSVDFFVSFGLSPVGLVVAGALSGAIGVRAYFVIVVLATLPAGLFMIASRRINEIDRGRATPTPAGEPPPETLAPAESPS
ncbi:MAG: MFS transporter [Acidobacteriota bacterium]|nr:MFS transporter [Acidobacteriota bacterium]